MDRVLDKLHSCPLFAQISREDLPGLMGCLGAVVKRIPRGSYLFREGDEAVWIGIVVSGSVMLLRDEVDGERTVMGVVGPGELFGASYAFSEEKELPLSVRAEAETAVVLLDSRRISSCCSNACAFHNQLIFNLLRLSATRNLQLQQRLRVTSRRTTREKLLEFLRHQAKLRGRRLFTIPYDRQALADHLGVDRSGLSAEISKLRREGILECEKSTFRLL